MAGQPPSSLPKNEVGEARVQEKEGDLNQEIQLLQQQQTGGLAAMSQLTNLIYQCLAAS